MILSLIKKSKKPIVIKRSDHIISRKDIDDDALKVLYRLSNKGYIAYLVGGGVRDLLLQRKPKDFDVSTDARPGQIKRLFRNCFLIGKRFRLAHIIFGRKVIETSTFRRQTKMPQECEEPVCQLEDNTFGTPQEDAKRRDFTVNGLFYDIKTFELIDYVGGLKDLEARVIRSIGNPGVRFREDPVRMIRALRFAGRLGFTIEGTTYKAIRKHHAEIKNASIPRVYEEILRLFPYQSACESFKLLWQSGLMQDLLPAIHQYVESTSGLKSPLWNYLAALDQLPEQDGEVSNTVRMAVLHYPLFTDLLQSETDKKNTAKNRLNTARMALQRIANDLHIPRATFYGAAMLLDISQRFSEGPRPGKSQRFVSNEAFPDALAFLKVLNKAENRNQESLNKWLSLSQRSGKPSQPHTKQAPRRRRKKPFAN